MKRGGDRMKWQNDWDEDRVSIRLTSLAYNLINNDRIYKFSSHQI